MTDLQDSLDFIIEEYDLAMKKDPAAISINSEPETLATDSSCEKSTADTKLIVALLIVLITNKLYS